MKSRVKICSTYLIRVLAAGITMVSKATSAVVATKRRNKAVPSSTDKDPVYDDQVNAQSPRVNRPVVHDDSQPLEPWAMNHNRNLARSRLCGLLPELTWLITQHLPPESIYQLRQTSRHFRGMFPPVQEQNERARSVIRSQLYCSPCRKLQENPQELENTRAKLRKPLWCSGCQENHPTVYFSGQQRPLPGYVRICIGREGYMRVCDHLIIYWSWLEVRRICPRFSIIMYHSSTRGSLCQNR